MARTSLALESGVVNETSQLERGNNETDGAVQKIFFSFIIVELPPNNESVVTRGKYLKNVANTATWIFFFFFSFLRF